MASYRGIEFAKDLDLSFADFKNMFAHTHVFKNIPPKEREQELKKAFKIAVPNGKLPRVTKKSKSDKTEESSS